MSAPDYGEATHCPICGEGKGLYAPVCDGCFCEANGAEFWKQTARKQSSLLARWATNTVTADPMPPVVADLLRDLIAVEQVYRHNRGLADAIARLATRARRIVEP